MPYDAKALLSAWLPGQEGGNAIADILFGSSAPSGRLLLTIPNKENEINFTQSQYPGVNNEEEYSEKLEVGYRWYVDHGVTPRYEFGFGLTYTTFAYTGFKVNPTTLEATLEVENKGTMGAYAVPQVYVGFPSSAGEPSRVLKGWGRVQVGAGKSATLSIQMSPRDVSTYNPGKEEWEVVDGQFSFMLGESSTKIVATQAVTISSAALSAVDASAV